MTTLIIDNYDSFTWNLVQLVGALGGEPVVFRNDEVGLPAIRALRPARVILSPGPGDPADPARIGVCADVLEALPELPILGVCLGHQIIARAFGARVIRVEPRHGKTSAVVHRGEGLFAVLPSPFAAMRYHSLAMDPAAVPAALAVTAWCDDGTVMGISHRQRPLFGVQFHPESIGTPLGVALVRAFLRVSCTQPLRSHGATP